LGIAYFFQHRYQSILNNLENKRMLALSEIKSLQNQTQNFSSLKKMSESKEIALNKIVKTFGHKKKYSEFLIEISKAITDEICLSEICINSRPSEQTSKGTNLANAKNIIASGKAGKFVSIKGRTNDTSEVMTFVKNLSKIQCIENVAINCIKQETEGASCYCFELSGQLKI